jgi:hypothetical protein
MNFRAGGWAGRGRTRPAAVRVARGYRRRRTHMGYGRCTVTARPLSPLCNAMRLPYEPAPRHVRQARVSQQDHRVLGIYEGIYQFSSRPESADFLRATSGGQGGR